MQMTASTVLATVFVFSTSVLASPNAAAGTAVGPQAPMMTWDPARLGPGWGFERNGYRCDNGALDWSYSACMNKCGGNIPTTATHAPDEPMGKCTAMPLLHGHDAFKSNIHKPTQISGQLMDVLTTAQVDATASPFVCFNCPIYTPQTVAIAKPSKPLRAFQSGKFDEQLKKRHYYEI